MSNQFMDAYGFGELLRERRRELGLSQAEVAAKVGASRQWIIELEKGKERAELGLAFKLAEVLGVQFKAQKRTPPKAIVLTADQQNVMQQTMRDLAASMHFLDDE